MKRSFKLFKFVLIFCMLGLFSNAQQKHFIYVQSEDRQPFAIVLKGKVYSSSDYGYIIIPNLTDGDYAFTVSFPMNKFPDQSFNCSLNKKDAGFYLKNTNNEWALQNMQTQKLVMNSNAATAQKNAFGDMLSDVVSDSTLTQNPAPSKPADNTGVVAGTIAATQVINDDSAAKGFITDSISELEKISESGTDTGTHMLFVDKTATGSDTISVFIPAEPATTTAVTDTATAGIETSGENPGQNNEVTKPAPDTVELTSLQNNNASEAGNTDVKNVPSQNSNADAALAATAAQGGNNPGAETQKADDKNITQPNNNTADAAVAGKAASEVSNPFYKPEQNVKPDSGSVSSNPISTSTNTSATAVKQDCAVMLSDEDLNKMKRKMFSQKNENDMVQYALKYINKKCLTTDQVKTLGYLFSSDDGRYNLYDAMYKFVYDYGNYSVLENQILDPYYKKRFAAMLR